MSDFGTVSIESEHRDNAGEVVIAGVSDDDDEEDFIRLPVDIQSCIILNQTYQKDIEDFLRYIENKLTVNRRIQKELRAAKIEQKDSCAKRTPTVKHPNSLIEFMAPYFKDVKGLHPPPNPDVIAKREKGEINLAYLQPNKPWSESDKNQLTRLVLNACLKYHLVPFYERKKDLLRQIIVNPDDENAKGKLMQIEDQIEQVNQASPQQLVISRDESNKLDWLFIETQFDTIHSASACELMWRNYLHPEINRNHWTYDEETALKSLVEKHKNKWDTIASELGTKRLPWQCLSKYQSEINPLIKRTGPFSKAEAEQLHKVVDYCRIGDYIPWSQVNYFIEGRTMAQIKHYWNKITLPKRGVNFSELEDRVLEVAVGKYGLHNWRKVAAFLPGRNNRQCRDRYINRVGIKDRKWGNFTEDEDKLILKLAPQLNFSWIKIQDNFPGRNAKQISCRYDFLKKMQSCNDGPNEIVITRKVYVKPKKQALLAANRLLLVGAESSLQSLNDDEFLRQSKEQLAQEVRKIKARQPPPGRSKMSSTEESLEQEITTKFVRFNQLGKKTKARVHNMTTLGQTFLDCARNSLQCLLQGEQTVDSHMLSKVVNRTIVNNVTRCFDEDAAVPSILPPNRDTLHAFRDLVTEVKYVRTEIEEARCMRSEIALSGGRHHFETLYDRFVAVFLWPFILSRLPVPEKPITEIEKTTVKHSRGKHGNQNVSQLCAIRTKQYELLRTATNSLLEMAPASTACVNKGDIDSKTASEDAVVSKRTPKQNRIYDNYTIIKPQVRKRRKEN